MKVEINSHGYYAKGKFIDYQKENGKLFAWIELQDGTVRRFEMPVYQIKFMEGI
jgi:hypothetical protein